MGGAGVAATTALIAGAGGALGAAVVSPKLDAGTGDVGEVPEEDAAVDVVEPVLGEVPEEDTAVDVIINQY